jgi:hypothetical protein
MRGSKEDMPVVMEAGEASSRQAEWGAMNIAIEQFPAGLDTTPLFKGLPDDRCQCPHWGYVLKGRIRVKYADRDEILNAGDAYYMAPGHLTVIEADAQVVEFSPKGEYQKTMEVAMSNMAAMQQA